MKREEVIWWVNHLFEIRKEEYFNKGMMKDAKEVEEAQTMVLEALSAESEPGEWILVKGSNGKDYHKCSKCLHTQEITGVKNYCAVCGARMKGGAE